MNSGSLSDSSPDIRRKGTVISALAIRFSLFVSAAALVAGAIVFQNELRVASTYIRTEMARAKAEAKALVGDLHRDAGDIAAFFHISSSTPPRLSRTEWPADWAERAPPAEDVEPLGDELAVRAQFAAMIFDPDALDAGQTAVRNLRGGCILEDALTEAFGPARFVAQIPRAKANADVINRRSRADEAIRTAVKGPSLRRAPTALAYAPEEKPYRESPFVPALKAAAPASGAAVPARSTAIYDISAAKVYLPDGTELEAHSGLGVKRDDPRFAHVRMKGATPPHLYDLSMRESAFHGVAALRLTPAGGARAVHNRDGLLAHTYMLGANGQSNGCVSFKDYNKFLAAYQNGSIRKLLVVPGSGSGAARMATSDAAGSAAAAAPEPDRSVSNN